MDGGIGGRTGEKKVSTATQVALHLARCSKLLTVTLESVLIYGSPQVAAQTPCKT